MTVMNSRSALLFAFMFLHVDADEGPLRAVQLFGKPKVSTGRLVVKEEGLAVLMEQTEPFAIISAVGPTRTGKSSILGRSFFRGDHENLFEVGSGVTSFTSGAWITSKPVVVQTENGPLRALVIDTEGFSGVGTITSKTYEANLFGMVYLMSSAVIFNSMFPVDASTVSNLNAHASHALQMVQALKQGGHGVHRARPHLFWSVQSFNVYNLRNSGMGTEDLLSALRNSSRRSGNVQTSEVLGEAATTSSAWLVERLFDDQELVPVRRPHTSDKVVANLGDFKSSMLSEEYLQDTDHLRKAVTRSLQPVHHCTEKGTLLKSGKCTAEALHGEEFVTLLSEWLKEGFIVDHSDLEDENETVSLSNLADRNRVWLDQQCKALRDEIINKFFIYRELTPANLQQREEVMNEVDQMMQGFPSASLSRMVESTAFWKHPGKGATLIEMQTRQAMQKCGEQLKDIRQHMETWVTTREHNIQVQKKLVEQVHKMKIAEGSPLKYTVLANDSTCFTETKHRLDLGDFKTLQQCAEFVHADCRCGHGFEYDATNGGYCGCGKAGTKNSDCMEDVDNFILGSQRLLLHNPSCFNSTGTLQENNATAKDEAKKAGNAEKEGDGGKEGEKEGEKEDGESGPDKRKARRVCFDVFDDH